MTERPATNYHSFLQHNFDRVILKIFHPTSPFFWRLMVANNSSKEPLLSVGPKYTWLFEYFSRICSNLHNRTFRSWTSRALELSWTNIAKLTSTVRVLDLLSRVMLKNPAKDAFPSSYVRMKSSWEKTITLANINLPPMVLSDWTFACMWTRYELTSISNAG